MSEIELEPGSIYPPIIIKPVTISSCAIDENNVNVTLDGEVVEGVSISVVSGTTTRTSQSVSKTVESLTETIPLVNSSDNLYHVSLMYNGTEIDSKTILKR